MRKVVIDNLSTLLTLSSRIRPLTDISIITFLSGLCEVCGHGEIHVETTPHTRNNVARKKHNIRSTERKPNHKNTIRTTPIQKPMTIVPISTTRKGPLTQLVLLHSFTQHVLEKTRK